MKLMNKFMKKHEGFTLVELIVVIAILAILAGVAVPAYSAYVTKANKSADQQLVSDIIYAAELAHYADALEDSASIVLTSDSTGALVEGSDEAKAWLNNVLNQAYGSGAATKFSLKYDGWGNGIAVAKTMLEALTSGDIATAMGSIYGDAENLSFTEEIPTLLDEIRNVAVAIRPGADDAGVISTVNGAAKITSGWSVEAIQRLWMDQIYFNSAADAYQCTAITDENLLPANESNFNKKLTIAGVVRAKNTCIALYIADKYPQYYDKLASFSVSDSSIVPMDLSWAANNPTGQKRLCTVLGLDPTSDIALDLLSLLNNGYFADKNANGTPIYYNDAAAYCAMMGIIDGVAEEGAVSQDNLDDYFNSVSGPAALFQQLVSGSLLIDELDASLSGVDAGNNNVTITFIGGAGHLITVVGPSNVLE